MQKDALLEIDEKVNNEGRMNTFLPNGKPRWDKSHNQIIECNNRQ